VGKSRYAEIADAIAGDLAGRRAGAGVASEHEIATRLGVSRGAARAAMRELESRLLVRRVRGSGTFVNQPIDYVISSRRPPSWIRRLATRVLRMDGGHITAQGRATEVLDHTKRGARRSGSRRPRSSGPC
jgi:DNA-binding GntR family transcriptional regulator